MSQMPRTPSFEDRRALIIHRPHATVDSIARQLTQIGIAADCHWPDLPLGLEVTGYSVMFFDADMGHDAQFPWGPGEAPMPAIALIGSEAPGRIAWAIKRGADAHLLKPVSGGGIYSAVLIARDAFDRRQALRTEVAGLKQRLSKRESLAEATALLMLSDHLPAAEAFRKLRLMAMAERLSIEAMAVKFIEQHALMQRRHDSA
jgi:AmiR/NasT family two-component response regulator